MAAWLRLLRDWLKALGPWRFAFAVLTAVLIAWAGPQLAALRRPRLDEQLLETHGETVTRLGHVVAGEGVVYQGRLL